MRIEKRQGRKPDVAEERLVEHVGRPGAQVKSSTRKETETRRRKVSQVQESVPGSQMGVTMESGLIASHLDRDMMRELRLGKLWCRKKTVKGG
jgi:hypothetical protein